MPDPPETNLFTRYVLENPYPLAGVLAVAAIALLWMGLRDGRRGMLYAAGAAVATGGVVLAIGMIVTTPAERGMQVTRDLVRAVERNDTAAALAMIANDATFTVGRPGNPGREFSFIRDQLERLAAGNPVQSIRITSLSGYTESPSRAEVHLSCRTEVQRGLFGTSAPTPSQWVLRVEEQPDGSWKVTRITAVSIAGQTPADRLW